MHYFYFTPIVGLQLNITNNNEKDPEIWKIE